MVKTSFYSAKVVQETYWTLWLCKGIIFVAGESVHFIFVMRNLCFFQ